MAREANHRKAWIVVEEDCKKETGRGEMEHARGFLRIEAAYRGMDGVGDVQHVPILTLPSNVSSDSVPPPACATL